MIELLTNAEMAAADQAAMATGHPGWGLMSAAGAAAAHEIRKRWPPRPTLVLCGPGNNGGDGFVTAMRLEAAGWPVRVLLVGERAALRGDAAIAAMAWNGETVPLNTALPPPEMSGFLSELLNDRPLIVDAFFGAGLKRPLDGAVKAVLQAVTARKLDCVAVDLPSGVAGDSGEVLGTAAAATLTITFFRRKPGHLLLPGRLLCGELVVADIGIPAAVLVDIAPRCFANEPPLWLSRFPWPQSNGHKYARGHAVVVGGARMTGASRLAAGAALRVGAGLVTLLCPQSVYAIQAGALDSVIVTAFADDAAFDEALADPRCNAVLLGPGNGRGPETKARVLTALATSSAHAPPRSFVLDADALTIFTENPDDLFGRLTPRCLLTPHTGEFARLFPDLADFSAKPGGKVAAARAAAARCGAVVLLKGADTVMAAPDGRAAINANAPPDLATAGAGDVLAGLCTGLMAQGLSAFDAACAGAWLHGDAAARHGPGLIADDIITGMPEALGRLKALSHQ